MIAIIHNIITTVFTTCLLTETSMKIAVNIAVAANSCASQFGGTFPRAVVNAFFIIFDSPSIPPLR